MKEQVGQIIYFKNVISRCSKSDFVPWSLPACQAVHHSDQRGNQTSCLSSRMATVSRWATVVMTESHVTFDDCSILSPHGGAAIYVDSPLAVLALRSCKLHISEYAAQESFPIVGKHQLVSAVSLRLMGLFSAILTNFSGVGTVHVASGSTIQEIAGCDLGAEDITWYGCLWDMYTTQNRMDACQTHGHWQEL